MTEPIPRHFADVVAAIYEAAVFPDRWPESLVAVRQLVGGESGMFALSYPASGRGEVLAADRLDLQTLTEWEQRHGLSPWVRAALAYPVGEVRAGHDLVPIAELQETPLYSEVLQPLGIEDMLAVLTVKEPFVLGFVSFYDRKLFGARASSRLRMLAPHLVRATSLRNRVAWLSQRAAAFEDGAERLPIGLALVGAAGDLLHANARARRILEAKDGLVARDGRLLAVDREARRALEDALRRTHDHATTELSLVVPRASSERPLQVVLSPSADREDRRRGATALVWIHDPEDLVIPTPESLEKLFGLTPAESRMAVALAGGETVREHAAAAGITEGTARVRLKQVLAKTGAHRQADLVRIVLTSVPGLLK